jgi:hypothetical protein
MLRFRIGDTVFLDGRRAKVVWLSENANEIEAMDEYIVEFENQQRQFAISSNLTAQKPQTIYNREHDRGGCHDQTY